jgi:hypothetical protein
VLGLRLGEELWCSLFLTSSHAPLRSPLWWGSHSSVMQACHLVNSQSSVAWEQQCDLDDGEFSLCSE